MVQEDYLEYSLKKWGAGCHFWISSAEKRVHAHLQVHVIFGLLHNLQSSVLWLLFSAHSHLSPTLCRWSVKSICFKAGTKVLSTL